MSRPFPALTSVVVVVVMVVALLTACGNDGPTSTTPTVTPPVTTAPAPPTQPAPAPTTDAATAPPTTAEYTTTTTEARPPVPAGVMVMIPVQNREDPAKNQFQVEIVNGTRDRYDVAGVQFVWDGFTTDYVARDAIVVGGQTIDFPVPFPGAACVGDGTRDTMPSLDDAFVRVVLQDATEFTIPVVDKWFLARKLYEDDCEKQMIESMVAIEWVDLHEADFEGRPVTAGELRLTRRDGVGQFVVLSVSNTIPFEFDAVDTDVDQPVVTLAEGEALASVPIRFIESRCDPHALAEIKQPTKFIAQIQMPDGTIRPYIIYPDRDLWTPMRLTADKACVALGKVEFVGDS